MQISPHVYSVHIDDDSFFHPGGSNIFFVGNVSNGMFMIDAGENDDTVSYTHLTLPTKA